MKGIILAGGHGTRLYPLTRVTSKQLLPIYNKPMVFYPLETLKRAGITDILLIVAPDHCGDYMKLLGSGREFGVNIVYEVQDKPQGLAQAFIIGEHFIKGDSVALILGDNIFEDDFAAAVREFKKGAQIFAKKVPDPERLGVVVFDQKMKVQKIVEKPKKWISDYAIPGFYLYDSRVVEAAKQVRPSVRGELEIVDVHNWYLKKGELKVGLLRGEWIDAGTFESYYRANVWAYERAHAKTDKQRRQK